MLEKLFGSNSRVKLLKLFLSSPREKFYIRQIARDLDLQLNSVRRELENLEKIGLLQVPKRVQDRQDEDEKDLPKQDKKYYQADSNFVLFDEIRSLMMKAHILYEKDFIEKIQSLGNLKLLILTGFFVNKPDSPADLLIVGRINKEKLLSLIKGLETELGREINYTVMEEKEFLYRKDVTDVFLFEILEGKRMVVVDEIGV